MFFLRSNRIEQWVHGRFRSDRLMCILISFECQESQNGNFLDTVTSDG